MVWSHGNEDVWRNPDTSPDPADNQLYLEQHWRKQSHISVAWSETSESLTAARLIAALATPPLHQKR